MPRRRAYQNSFTIGCGFWVPMTLAGIVVISREPTASTPSMTLLPRSSRVIVVPSGNVAEAGSEELAAGGA